MKRALVALYASLTYSLPAEFRREYAHSMRRDFADGIVEERALRGPFAALVFSLGASADLLLTALREYSAMIFRDLTFAFRSLRKTPFFTLVIVATLALAIGANATAFSILRAVVLAPLPYPQADRLVAITGTLQGAPFSISLPDFYDLSDQSASFEHMAAFTSDDSTLTGHGGAMHLAGTSVTAGFFETLEAQPELGRFFTDADARAGAPATVVLSDARWRTTFNADPLVVGSAVRLDGKSYRVIGIAPATLQQPDFGIGFARSDYWFVLPIDIASSQNYSRGAHYFDGIARLRDDVTPSAAGAELATIFARLRVRYPDEDARFGVVATSLVDRLVGNVRPTLYAIFAAVALVLLVACANVANLLLSRAATRDREMAVRVAIGATRNRVIAQLLTETFALALLGGAAGMALAAIALRAFLALKPPGIPRADEVTFDLGAAVYTLGIVAFCTFAAGLAPALSLSRESVATSLKAAGRSGDASRGRRARGALVIAEIALMLSLVIGAGLVVRSFVALTSQPLGFSPGGVTLVGPIAPPPQRYSNSTAMAGFYERALNHARAIPGVADAGWGCCAPFSHNTFNLTFDLVGQESPPNQTRSSLVNLISDGYLHTMQIPLRAGRDFTSRDRRNAPDVVIVNEAFARVYFPGASAIGHRIYWGSSARDSHGKLPPQRTIVGVARDVRDSYAKPPAPMLYLPITQALAGDAWLAVRANSPSAITAVSNAIQSLDSELPPPPAYDYAYFLSRDAGRATLSALALGTMAVVALVLALAGIFAVVSYGVAQRTHEFGVRMALGARASTILRTVVGGAMRLALAGTLLGIVIAAVGTRFLGDQLYATQPLDPLTFGVVSVAIALAALIAAIVPARRATRVDPVVALRYD